MITPLLLYTTFATQQQAKDIIHILLEKKLIACANILPHVQSFYHWNDGIACEDECIVLLKSISSLKDSIVKELAENHPYATPCIIELNTQNVFAPYLSWLESVTTIAT